MAFVNTTVRSRGGAVAARSMGTLECSFPGALASSSPTGRRTAADDRGAVLNRTTSCDGLEGVLRSPLFDTIGCTRLFSATSAVEEGRQYMDLGKSSIDYGFHPYTTAFPLIGPGAL